MKVRFWGTRGSLPVALTAKGVQAKIAKALVAAGGRTFAGEAEAAAFAGQALDFAVCDMGSGVREFGIDSARRVAAGHPAVYHFFLSHLHWDHIMGFPFFGPAFNPNATI